MKRTESLKRIGTHGTVPPPHTPEDTGLHTDSDIRAGTHQIPEPPERAPSDIELQNLPQQGSKPPELLLELPNVPTTPGILWGSTPTISTQAQKLLKIARKQKKELDTNPTSTELDNYLKTLQSLYTQKRDSDPNDFWLDIMKEAFILTKRLQQQQLNTEGSDEEERNSKAATPVEAIEERIEVIRQSEFIKLFNTTLPNPLPIPKEIGFFFKKSEISESAQTLLKLANKQKKELNQGNGSIFEYGKTLSMLLSEITQLPAQNQFKYQIQKEKNAVDELILGLLTEKKKQETSQDPVLDTSLKDVLSEVDKAMLDYEVRLDSLRKKLNQDSSETSGLSKEALERIPKYLKGEGDWQPLDGFQGIFESNSKWTTRWFETPEELKTRKEREEAISIVDPIMQEAQKYGTDLKLISVRIDILSDLSSPKADFDRELEELKISEILIRQYINKLDQALKEFKQLLSGKALQIQQQISTEKKHAESQHRQITTYLEQERNTTAIKSRESARTLDENTTWLNEFDALIKAKMESILLDSLEKDPKNTDIDLEALFHRAVSEIYTELIECSNIQDFIPQFTIAIEECFVKKFGKSDNTKAQGTTQEDHSDKEYVGLKEDILTKIKKQQSDINTRQEKNKENILKTEISLQQLKASSAADEDILKAIRESIKKREDAFKTLMRTQDFTRAKIDFMKQFIQRINDYENKTQLLELLEKKELSSVEIIKLFKILRTLCSDEANKPELLTKYNSDILQLEHVQKQSELIIQIKKQHLKEQEDLYRNLYLYRQEQIGLEIETNNLRTRWLVLQKQNLEQESTRLNIINSKDTQNTIQITNNITALNALNLRYRKSLLELQNLVNSENKRRQEASSILHADLSLSDFAKKLFNLDHIDLSDQFREIDTTRQLALNGLASIMEAIRPLGKDTINALRKLSKITSNDLNNMNTENPLWKILKYATSLQEWVSKHPLQARRFAGNIKHASNILQNKGFAEIVWNRATIEDLITDAFLGSRNHIAAAHEIEVIPHEVLAMLYLADWLPEASHMAKTLFSMSTLESAWSAGSTSALCGGPILGIAVGFAVIGAKAVGAYAQATAERKVAQVVSQNRDAEVTVNALIAGANAEGGIKDRIKTAAAYMVARQAAQQIGSLSVDVQEKGWFQGTKRWLGEKKDLIVEDWRQASTKGKALRVAGIVAVGIVGAATAGVAAIGTALVLPYIAVGAAVGLVVGGIVLGIKQVFFASDEIKDEVKKKIESERIKETIQKLQMEENLTAYEITQKEVQTEAEKILLKARTDKKTVGELENSSVLTMAQKAQTSPDGQLIEDEKYWRDQASTLNKAIQKKLQEKPEEKLEQKNNV